MCGSLKKKPIMQKQQKEVSLKFRGADELKILKYWNKKIKGANSHVFASSFSIKRPWIQSFDIEEKEEVSAVGRVEGRYQKPK